MTSPAPDVTALKSKLRDTWIAGDFGQIAKYTDQWAEDFVSPMAITSDLNVLDVACGTGNIAIAIGRRRATVTGVDIAPNLIAQARARAEAEDLKIQFDEGDAEALPYADATFHLVATMFGSMFTPRPEVAAAELLRVCRPGGRVIMGNWTPEGFTGEMFKITSKYAPHSPAMKPPVLWGNEETVRERFNAGVADLRMRRRPAEFIMPFSEPDVVEHFRLYFGPVQRAFESLDPEKQSEYRQELEAVWKKHNRATDGTTRVVSEYLEVVAVRE